MLSTLLHLIINLLLVQLINSQAEKCDCEDEYGTPFCDGIENKDNECYIGGNKQKLSAKGTHCAKSCDTCCKLPRFQCEDRIVRLNCASIKANGLCKTANSALLSLISAECPKTCGLCGRECADTNVIICSILKSNCDNEESRKVCPKTCKVCQSPNLCFDTTEHCASAKNRCNDPILKPLMQSTCNETCGFCQSESSTKQPDVEVCADTDPRCAAWAANGFCTNPFYKPFIKDCLKTCRLCV
uniref:ShKT domain-containing protein n=1 Tax=Setaria digitata TaxID=48799 RepID=A0A915Q677_9BILA